jgi:penicillin-binding protein 2
MLLLFLVLSLRLWQLQVLDGDRYNRLSEENRLRIIRTAAPRGIIYDRNGIPLVENIPTFSASIIPENLKDLDTGRLSSLLGLRKEDLEEKLNRKDASPFVPIRLKQGLTYQEVARVEASRSAFPGLSVETEVGRHYAYGKIGAHVIGYLGKPTASQMGDGGARSVAPDLPLGQWGVEALFDDKLRGFPGERVIEVDARGRELRVLQQRKALRGEDVRLALDIGIQKAVEETFGGKAGALVAIKPTTGEVLALESFPSFDPNMFSAGLTPQQWKSLTEDRRHPMLNRAVQSQYPPGSTFKIITAVAALEEGVISTVTKVFCTGGLDYGRWTFGCWRKGGHGMMDFHKAVVESCDVYFYEVGKRLGIERLYKYATAFGLGRETGLVLAKEKKGLIPTAEWKKDKRGLPWYLGDTFISSIGQGFVSATPIQMAIMTAAVAYGGTLYKPALFEGEPVQTGKLTLKPATINFMKGALSGVVNEPNGTAKGARSSLATVAGKTGTAQVASKRKGSVPEKLMDHAWFVAFAPVNNPEIAVAVFVEHGGGGGAVAAPIAKKAIEAYLSGKNRPEERGERTSGQALPRREREDGTGPGN